MKLRNFYTPIVQYFTQKNNLSVFLLLVGGSALAQQTVPLQIVPFSAQDSDYIAPARGAEEWMGMNLVPIPAENAAKPSADTYIRFEWGQFEMDKNSYDFSSFDAACLKAIKNNQHLSFGVMSICSSCGGKATDGAKMMYPKYVHDQMQLEAAKDWMASGIWIPNWNSDSYLLAWENLLKAIGNHIQNTVLQGVPLRNIINYIDIRGYGNWGEWHNYPYKNSEPNANKATAKSLLRIINAHKTAFPNIRLVAMSDAFDVANWSSVPAEVGYYLLTAANNIGQFGWRRDNWGDPAVWYRNKLENNNTLYNGMLFKTLIMNKWKFAPIVGEPSSCCTINGGNCQYWELENQVIRYHASSFGNGNLEVPNATCVRNNIRAAAKAAGYRISIDKGTATLDTKASRQLQMNIQWKNIGIAPLYEKWDTYFQLKNAANTVVWSGKSTINLRTLMPQSPTSATDQFNLPTNLPSGNYQLFLVIKDPNGFRKPLPISIKGRTPDGAYPLTPITLPKTINTSNTINQLPKADAGIDQMISLPQQTALLDGTKSSDPDGTIVHYLWRQLGGTGLVVFTDTSAPTATISKLMQGIYHFQLSVTDNLGDTATDDVVITVNAAPAPTLHLPSAKATFIPINETQYLLNGAASTSQNGPIIAYHWKIISGPEGAQLQYPDSAKTIVENLSPGNYTVELQVIDNMKATSTTQLHFIVTTSTPTTINGPTNKLYPNPTHNQLHIQIVHGAIGLIHFTVYNAIGTMVMMASGQKSNPTFLYTLNTSSLPNGIYLLKINIGKSDTLSKKFIKI